MFRIASSLLILSLICGLVMTVAFLFRQVDHTIKRSREAENMNLLHEELHCGMFDDALDRIKKSRNSNTSATALRSMWLTAGTLSTSPVLERNHRGELPDEFLLDTLMPVLDKRIAPKLQRNPMQCFDLADKLLSAPLGRERAYALCAYAAYRDSGDQAHLIGLPDRITSAAFNSLPLSQRTSILARNERYREIIALVGNENLGVICSSPFEQTHVQIHLLTAYKRLRATTEALALVDSMLSGTQSLDEETSRWVSNLRGRILSGEFTETSLE